MPRPTPTTEKVQFSVMMDLTTKEKLDLIASVMGETVSKHLEKLVQAEIAAIDAKTWQAMQDVRKQVYAATGRKPDPSPAKAPSSKSKP